MRVCLDDESRDLALWEEYGEGLTRVKGALDTVNWPNLKPNDNRKPPATVSAYAFARTSSPLIQKRKSESCTLWLAGTQSADHLSLSQVLDENQQSDASQAEDESKEEAESREQGSGGASHSHADDDEPDDLKMFEKMFQQVREGRGGCTSLSRRPLIGIQFS